MKKNILFLIICVNLSFVFAKDMSRNIFKDYFNSEDESYEFNVLNPFYFDEFYIKDVSKLKNKVLKRTYETYRIDENGDRFYSDTVLRDVMYTYYFFDEKGRISDEYHIDVCEDGYIYLKKHTTYSCSKDEYVIREQNLDYEDVYTAKIISDGKSLILDFDKCYYLYTKYIFAKDHIIKENDTDSKWISYIDCRLDDSYITKLSYSVHEGVEDKNWQTTSDSCCTVSDMRFIPSGDETYIYEEKNKGHGAVVYNKGNTVSKTVLEYSRIFNPIGFVEYEEIKPFGTKAGNYRYLKQEVLNKTDNLFLEYFQDTSR